VFDRGFRLEFLVDVGDDLEEALFEFTFQDYGFGEETMFEGVG
jgi:hypothetical protein